MIVTKIYIILLLFAIRTCYGQQTTDWHFAGPNVALHKKAYQYPGAFNNQVADLAVDGNSMYGIGRSCSHTEQGVGSYYPRWRVDLGAFYYLTGIRIYNSDPFHRDRLANFSIRGRSRQGHKTLISRNNEYMDTIIRVSLDGTTEFNSISIYLPPNKDDSFLTLCEVQVFARGCSGIMTDDSFTASLIPGSGQYYYIANKVYNAIGALIKIQCKQGYTPQSPFNIQCQPNTNYNYKTKPFCRQNFCNLPPNPKNGSYELKYVSWYDISRNLAYVKSRVQAVCYMGYKLNGNGFRTCQSGGIWSEKIPNCKIDKCPYPYWLQHGHFTHYNSKVNPAQTPFFSFYTVLRVICEYGFKVNASSNAITCGSSGTWRAHVNCIKQSCQIPMLKYGFYQEKNSANVIDRGTVIQLGYVVKPACVNDSYQLQTFGVVERQCQANGRLNRRDPVCVPLCDAPIITNGIYIDMNTNKVNGIQQRDQVTVRCNPGYDSNNGHASLTCKEDHTWRGQLTVCNAKSCSIDTLHVHLDAKNTITATNIQTIVFNETLQLECKEGYEQLSGDQVLRCNETQQFEGNPLICTAKTCSIQTLHLDANNTITASDVQTIGFNRTLSLECKEGYKQVSGDRVLRCDENQQFEGNPLNCKAKTCSVDWHSFDAENVTVSHDIKRIFFNETLHLECKKGHKKVSGEQGLRCNETKQLEGDPLKCKAVQESISENSKQVGGIIAGVGGGCAGFILVIAILLVLLYRRRTQRLAETSKGNRHTIELPKTRFSFTNNKNKTGDVYSSGYETNNTKSEDNDYNTVTDGNIYNDIQNEEEDCSHDYYSFTVEKLPKSAIRVSQLVQRVLVGDHSEFQHQFESFPKRMDSSYNASVKTENRGKNKYKEMYPYDETRVVLQPGNLKSETDYINASFINGFSEPKRYIAAQAPFEPTLNDFWRMIWQMNVSKIVMLTKLKEEVKVKCDQYWPNKDSVMFGRIKVTFKKTETFSDFVIRHFVISKDDSTNRKVIQFHFTSWPDKDVPKYASSLVRFRQKAMNAPTDTKGPVVVHCSAGVGRTGTFIALDIMVEQGNRLKYVDVLGCVQTLRKQRVMMVQTMQQYLFIHLALVEALMLSPSVLPAATFIESYGTALEINPDTGKRYIDSEFEMLKSMSPSAEESQYVSAMEIRNRKKNRYPNILPDKDFMPRLKDEPDNCYINAVILPSYKTKDAFIITQAPLENTQEEFWRLVHDHKVHSIVMMNTVKELEIRFTRIDRNNESTMNTRNPSIKKDSEIYWPQGEEIVTYNNQTVTLIETEEVEDHNIMTLEMTVSNKKRKIRVFQYCHKVTCTFPGSPENVLVLMELVQYWQQQTGNNPIVVHCMNGVDKSGLYCVISAVIERLKTEQDVAISQTIEVMRNSREQLISSVEQFKFCHDVVLTYLKQFETYSNFVEVHI